MEPVNPQLSPTDKYWERGKPKSPSLDIKQQSEEFWSKGDVRDNKRISELEQDTKIAEGNTIFPSHIGRAHPISGDALARVKAGKSRYISGFGEK